MAKTYEYNPWRGTYYVTEDDPQTGGLFISTMQDTKPVLDRNKKLRNSGKNDKVGTFNHYATIPAAVELILKERGLSIYDKNNTSAIMKVIESEFPYVKVTNLKHLI